VLIRVSPPSYQVSLWLFLQNSGIEPVERVGGDGVRVSDDYDAEHVTETLALWRSLYNLGQTEIVSEAEPT